MKERRHWEATKKMYAGLLAGLHAMYVVSQPLRVWIFADAMAPDAANARLEHRSLDAQTKWSRRRVPFAFGIAPAVDGIGQDAGNLFPRAERRGRGFSFRGKHVKASNVTFHPVKPFEREGYVARPHPHKDGRTCSGDSHSPESTVGIKTCFREPGKAGETNKMVPYGAAQCLGSQLTKTCCNALQILTRSSPVLGVWHDGQIGEKYFCFSQNGAMLLRVCMI